MSNLKSNTQTLEYRDEDTVLEAYYALPSLEDASEMRRPTVLVFHAFGGRDAFVCHKAEALAALGYVGVAVDIYGKGVLGHSRQESAALMKPFLDDRARLRKRILAAWESVKSLPFVDSNRIGAIGFCFGGLCALDLARAGVPLKGVVSFHGRLSSPGAAPEGSKKEVIQSKVLVLHGHDDPMVPPDQVLAFQKEMTESKADWQMHTYSNTMHGFTAPLANDPGFGTVYQRNSDFRSWKAMKNFFEEVFEC